MAGDWLKVETITPDKPEVFEIAVQLKITPPEAFGRLFLVWRWFDQQTEDGNAVNVTSAYLDHISGVTGFSEAMRSVGWLAGGVDGSFGLKLPNFDRHNGQTAKNRALTAKRVATHKKRSANAEVTHKPLPREEKRRDNPIVPSLPFETFWKAWPQSSRKGAKGECWGLWRKRGYDAQVADIVRHVEAMKQTQDWMKNGGEFIPAPKPYLNQRRWEGADGVTPRAVSPLYRREGAM